MVDILTNPHQNHIFSLPPHDKINLVEAITAVKLLCNNDIWATGRS